MRVKFGKIKHMLLAVAFALFAGCLSLVYAISTDFVKAYASSVPTSYGVYEASIRIPSKNGDTYENGGLRFHTRMTEDEYNTYKAGLEAGTTKTGLLLLPQAIAQGEDLTLETSKVANADTSKAWSKKEGNGETYYEANVVLVGIPNKNEGTDMVVRPYVTVNGETKYFDEKWDTSIAGVARQLYDIENNNKTWGTDGGALTKEVESTLKEAYLDRKITCHESDGTTTNKTVMYGDKIDAGHLENGEAYRKNDMTVFDAETNLVRGDMTLYAVQEQNVLQGTPELTLSSYTQNGFTIAGATIDGQNVYDQESGSLVIPSSIGLGDQQITVTMLDPQGKEVSAVLDGTIVTQLISTPEEFVAITPFWAGGNTGGYYKLANDIVLKARNDLKFGVWDSDWASHAFTGVFDGNGYTITSQSYYCTGMFMNLTGATLKHVNIVDEWYNGYQEYSLIARKMVNSLLDDVVIRVSVAQAPYCKEGENRGLLTQLCAQNNTFRNLIIDASNVNVGGQLESIDLISLFGGNTNISLGFRDNTFEDCIVYAKSLANIGYHYDQEGTETALHVYSSSDPMEGLSIITDIHEHTYTKWLTKVGYDQLVCSRCNLPSDVKFDKVADDKNQSLILPAEKVVASMVGISDYADVVSVKFGAYDLGDDLNNLSIPSEMKADTQNHGKQNLTVVVTDTITGGQHTVTLPVVLVTDEITSLEELVNTVRRPADVVSGTKFHIYGYYQIVRDITDVDYRPNRLGRDWSSGIWGSGFHGTIDGLGYTIKGNFGASNFNDGPFGLLFNATIKNLTIESTEYNGASYTCLLATQVYQSTIDNVTFRVLGGDGTIEVGDNKALLIAGATDANTVFNNVTVNASGLNIGYLSNSAVPTFTGNCSFTATSYRGIAPSTMTADNLTINASTSEQHSYVWEVGTTEDYYKCEFCDTVIRTFDKTVDDMTREVVLTGGSSLDLAGISEYVSISDIAYGTYSLGANAESLARNDSLLTATAEHGENKTLTVTVVDDTDATHTISVPVTLITGVITTMEQLDSAVRYYGTAILNSNGAVIGYEEEGKSGYYILGNDISYEEGYTPVKGATASYFANTGFMGTLDGRDHTITWDMGTNKSQYGVFGTLYQATLKNVTIDAVNYKELWGACVLGYYVNNAKLTNVVINLDGVGTSNEAGGYGVIVGNALYSGTWTNVTINSKIAMGTVFGAAKNINSSVTFVNSYLNTIYYGRLSGDNASELGGLNVNVQKQTKEYVLPKHTIVLSNATNKITLGVQTMSSFTATIKSEDGTYDFGTDVTNLSTTEIAQNKEDHGEMTLIVTGSEPGTDYTFTVPALIVTADINTTQGLFDAVYPKGESKDGYYRLTADINFTAAVVTGIGDGYGLNSDSAVHGADSGYYFTGTLDGNGYKITSQTTSYGIFNSLNGATIKNVTIDDAWCVGSSAKLTLLAKTMKNTTLDNVKFTISAKSASYATSVGSGCGWLVMSTCTGNTFNNVTVDTTCGGALDGVGSLFGTGFDKDSNSFTDVTVKATSVAEVGHNGADSASVAIADVSGIELVS